MREYKPVLQVQLPALSLDLSPLRNEGLDYILQAEVCGLPFWNITLHPLHTTKAFLSWLCLSAMPRCLVLSIISIVGLKDLCALENFIS